MFLKNVKGFVVVPWNSKRKKGLTVGEIAESLKAQMKPLDRHMFYLMIKSAGAIDDEAREEWQALKDQVGKTRKA